MIVSSCKGFLDSSNIWNNGFDCPPSQICCGTDVDRYCCLPSSTSTTITNEDIDSSLHDQQIFFRICTFALCFVICILMIIIVYLYSINIRQQRKSMEISTMNNIETKSRCTESSIILHSTRESSFYLDPNELEYLCT